MTTLICCKCNNPLNINFGMTTHINCQQQGCGHKVFFVSNVSRHSAFTCVNCKNIYPVIDGKFDSKCSNCGGEKYFFGLASDKNNLILVLRNRGLGDVLMTTIAIRELKKQNPDCMICYGVDPDVMGILEHNPNIDHLVSIDHGRKIENYSRKVDLVESVEDYNVHNGVNRRNRILRFMELCGVYNGQEGPLIPDYFITEEEKEWAEEFLPTGRKVIAIALESAARYRTWSELQFRMLCRLFDRSKVDILIIGEKTKGAEWMGAGYINTTGKLNVRQLGALIARCSVVISGDTGPSHFAAALGVPAITFYGAIPPDARALGYYPKTICFYHPSAARCIPCWDNQSTYPQEYQECRAKGAMCMEAIPVDKVFKQTMKIIEGASK